MTPIKNLSKEHKDIDELLNIMNKIAVNINSNEFFYTNDVKDIIPLFLIRGTRACK